MQGCNALHDGHAQATAAFLLAVGPEEAFSHARQLFGTQGGSSFSTLSRSVPMRRVTAVPVGA